MAAARATEAIARYHRSAAELERFARWTLSRAADAAAKEQAQQLLRHAVGCRRAFERWTESESSRRP